MVGRVCAYAYRTGAVCFANWARGLATRDLRVQHDSPVSLHAIAATGNNLMAAGAAALCPALERLTNIAILNLGGTCGAVQRRSTQCEQWGGERAGHGVVVGDFFTRERAYARACMCICVHVYLCVRI